MLLSSLEGAVVLADEEIFVGMGLVFLAEKGFVGGGIVPACSYLRLLPFSFEEARGFEEERGLAGRGGLVPVLSHLQCLPSQPVDPCCEMDWRRSTTGRSKGLWTGLGEE